VSPKTDNRRKALYLKLITIISICAIFIGLMRIIVDSLTLGAEMNAIQASI
jgi:hypothetical protein